MTLDIQGWICCQNTNVASILPFYIASLDWTQFQVIKSLISYKHCIWLLSLALYQNNDKDDLIDIRSFEKIMRYPYIGNRDSILDQSMTCVDDSRSLFAKPTDVLPQVLVKSRSREIECYDNLITLKFHRHPDSAAATWAIKFHSDWNSLNPNIAASSLRAILW